MDTMGYLRKIGQFGKNPDGSYTRRIFSPEWERAADLVRSEMKALSMKTDRDAAGNEHGVLLGSVPGLPAAARTAARTLQTPRRAHGCQSVAS